MARLVFVEGPWKGVELGLDQAEHVLGRDPSCELAVPDASLSRRHLRFVRQGEVWAVEDLASRNGTLHNDQPLTSAILRDGDRLVAGRHVVAFRVADAAEPGSVTTIVGDVAGTGDELALLLELSGTFAHAPDADHLVDVTARWILARLDAATALVYHRRGLAMAADRVVTRHAVAPPGAGKVPAAAVLEVARHGNASWTGTKMGGLAIVPVGARADVVIVISDLAEPARRVLRVITLAAHLCAGQLSNRFRAEVLSVRLSDVDGEEPQLVAASPAMVPVLEFVERAAQIDSTVLLLGESGTGKELVARSLHRNGPRRDAPFVAVNCAAIPAGLLEAELFGHERGAFTGAVARRRGCFELAGSGTLLLDEIGELSPQAQAGLLRVLEERTIQRLGSEQLIPIDVRVVAATHRDLRAAVDAGTFREDLYFRLSVLVADLPPLRDRRDDIQLLAERFLTGFRSRTTRRVTGFAPAALEALRAYAWPGNIRELRNVVERAVMLGRSAVIEPGDLPPDIIAVPPSSTAAIEQITLPMASAELERRNLLAALAATDGNKTRAAALLGIDRVTLYNRLKSVDK